MNRLLHQFGISQPDMFRSYQDLLAEAYQRQEERIAFSASEEDLERLQTIWSAGE